MNYETELIESIAAAIAVKSEAAATGLADNRLVIETERLYIAVDNHLQTFTNETQRDTFINKTLCKLVKIADLLFDMNQSNSSDTQMVIDLLARIKALIPFAIDPRLPLPKAFIIEQRTVFAAKLELVETLLKAQGIDPLLIKIAALPFQFGVAESKLLWRDYTWLKGYVAKLDAVDWDNTDCGSKTEAVMSLLIGCDFNHPRFFIYCKRYIVRRVRSCATKRKRLNELAQCKKLIQQDTQTGKTSYDCRESTISAMLLNWVKEESDAVKANEQDDYTSKLSVMWNVETLAFFFKLLWDHKVVREVTLDVFSQQIAAAFASKHREDFKAKTIAARFYTKDLTVLKIMEALLVAMLADVRLFLR
jgi:hypothetical protein